MIGVSSGHWRRIVVAAAIAATLALGACSSDDDDEYVMAASEVEAIENRRYEMLAKAPRPEMADEPGFTGQPLPEGST